MNARFATNQLGSSCAAYGCTSAQIRPILDLDAANALVVSICVAVVRISG